MGIASGTRRVNPVTGLPGQGGGTAFGGAFGSSQHPSGGGTIGKSGALLGTGGGSSLSASGRNILGATPGGGAGAGSAGMGQQQAYQAPPPPKPYQPLPQQPQMPYQPGAPAAAQTAQTMSQYGTEMLNPNSPESRRMQEILTGRIGEETGAAKRLAAFQASQAGMGGGQSQELMAMLGDIDIAGMETGGRASAEMMTQLPQMGMGFLQGGLQGQLGVSGQDLQAWLGQQQMNQQAENRNMESYYRGQEMDLERQRLAEQARQAEMNTFAGMFV